MKLTLYFLILINIVILLLNWDNYTSKSFVYSDIQEGETLRLINEQQLPARALAEQPQASSRPNPLAIMINAFLDILSSTGNIIGDFFRDDRRPLPEESTPSIPSAPRPSPRPPIPPIEQQQLADYCIRIGDFSTLAEAEDYSNRLADQDVVHSLKETTHQPIEHYQVVVLARTGLDIAIELSDMLSENGIKTSVKENRPLGYILSSPIYQSEAQANKALNQAKKLGMSARLEVSHKAVEKTYVIHVAKDMVPILESLTNIEALQQEATFKQDPDC